MAKADSENYNRIPPPWYRRKCVVLSLRKRKLRLPERDAHTESHNLRILAKND